MKKVETKNKINKEEVEIKKEFDLDEAFALWDHIARSGEHYLTGSIEDMKLICFYNKEKKNEKEPDYRVYIIENDEISKEAVASLWRNVSKNGKFYLSGKDNENKKLVGFYNDNFMEFPNRPLIRVYYQKENN